MSSNDWLGFSDADAAALATIVHDATLAHAQVASGQARLTRALASAAALAEKQAAGSPAPVKERDMALRGIAAEIAGALRSTDRAIQRRISDAVIVAEGFPATLDAFEAGAITRAHMMLIVELGQPLPPEARAEFETLALLRCEEETANRLKSELGILAEHLHPRTLTERHRERREQRGIRVAALGEGMSELIATLPTLHAEAIYNRLTQQGIAIVDARRQARERLTGDTVDTADQASGAEPTHDEIIASDTRTMDQLRADVFTDMLLTAQPGADPTRTDDGPGTLGAIRAKVQVVVPALSLIGAAEHPADLAGRSPIDADTARRLAGGTHTWDRILTDPVTGTVLATDTRFPTPAMRRHLHARDQHCRFPGCRIPAIRCEADHTVDHAYGGATDIRNLECLCQRHHSMKQFTAWKVRQLGDGVLEWTSPLGHTYTDEPPPPAVHFTLDAAPAPGP